MKIMLLSFIMGLFVIFSSAAESESNQPSEILVMGDSLLASHSISNRAISNSLENTLRQDVTDRSVMGARMIYRLPISGALGLNISKQYTRGNWKWIIINGGGNDLWLGCGCNRCDRKLNQLISSDGASGEIPKLIARLHNTGAQVIYLGYLRSPGVNSPIEDCKDEGDALERRVSTLAAKHNGVYFLSLADLVPHGDRTYHTIDMIHPSLKASREIGQLLARMIMDGKG